VNAKRQRLYLKDILERIRRIAIASAEGHEAFIESVILQDAVIRSFEVIGEIVKRLDPTLTAAHPDIPWRRIAGFRDVLIHRYEQVDLDAVWRIVVEDIPPLQTAAEAMLADLDKKAQEGE
jgi:uncharacterized protein with HEPN domain